MRPDESGGAMPTNYWASTAAAMSAAGKKAMKYEGETLKKFKQRVDALLADLEESEAAPTRLAEDRMTTEDLGRGFGEAGKLYATYNEVHNQLETLSKLLGSQIKGMGIAVEASHSSYSELELDIQRRMRAIQREAKQRYVPDHDPNAATNE